MTLDGCKIVVITKDDQSKPDLSKAALAEAYQDDIAISLDRMQGGAPCQLAGTQSNGSIDGYVE